jgi:hypothetical protein
VFFSTKLMGTSVSCAQAWPRNKPKEITIPATHLVALDIPVSSQNQQIWQGYARLMPRFGGRIGWIDKRKGLAEILCSKARDLPNLRAQARHASSRR